MGGDVIGAMGRTGVPMGARLISSRVITGVYDQGLRTVIINSPQFGLLAGICNTVPPPSRAEIGRFHY